MQIEWKCGRWLLDISEFSTSFFLYKFVCIPGIIYYNSTVSKCKGCSQLITYQSLARTLTGGSENKKKRRILIKKKYIYSAGHYGHYYSEQKNKSAASCGHF